MSAPGKTRAGHLAYVMNPEYLAEIERFRLMDDTFMSKCLENAPRRYMCEAMERIEARGEARGKREGKRENMLATAKRLLANGKLMLKEISECPGLSLAQVKKLQLTMA